MSIQVQTEFIIDVNQANFEEEVIQRSHTTPVVVDFWAAWCGPCRALGPVLEKLANKYQGKFILAKVDVDQNQMLAQQFWVQGIPAVKAFVEGKVAGEFTGAQPEPRVREFLQKLMPTKADMFARQAYQWEMSQQLPMAVTNYQAALKEDAAHHPAMVGLGRTLLKQGEVEQALTWLEKIPAGLKEYEVARALMATAQFQKHAAGHSEASLQATLAENPHDVASYYALASLRAVNQNYAGAMDAFLEVIRRDRSYEDDGARKAMLALFTSIGEDHPLTRTYRNKLASALF
jgi:putative thioredoxin